jgi:hypothetical protein
MSDPEFTYDDITAIADAIDFRKVLHLYLNVSFDAGCDELIAQIDKAVEELPELDESEEWLDSRDRARDMNAESA